MLGYNREEAEQFILERLVKADFKPVANRSEELVKEAISLDFAYMQSTGVIAEDGVMGNAYYDDDEAFEFMFDRMVRARGLSEDDPMNGALAAFLDQYMDLQQGYLEQAGLMAWD